MERYVWLHEWGACSGGRQFASRYTDPRCAWDKCSRLDWLRLRKSLTLNRFPLGTVREFNSEGVSGEQARGSKTAARLTPGCDHHGNGPRRYERV